MNAATTTALAVLAGAVAWLLRGPDGTQRRARLMIAGGAWTAAGPDAAVRLEASPVTSFDPPRRQRPENADLLARTARLAATAADRAGVEALCLSMGALSAWLLASPLPLIAGIVAAPAARRLLRRRVLQREAVRRSTAVTELCTEIAAELRAGRPANAALVEAVADCDWPPAPGAPRGLADVLAAARFGGDVPEALRRAAWAPGAEGLAGVAACWQVGIDSGAGLAEGLDRVASALRAREQHQEELRAQLAGPRTTAVLLAVLPLFGVLLGTAMGAQPLHVLLHTPVGLACLGFGVALECVGLAWTARIVRGAS